MSVTDEAVVKSSDVVEEEILVLAFKLDKEEYGLDVGVVQEIVRIKDITRVPKAPHFIRGVINLRGDVIPVIDLRRLFHLGETEINARYRIIVLNIMEKRFGIIVDDVSEVIRFSKDQIEMTPATVSDTIDSAYIRGVGKVGSRLIILLNLVEALGLSKGEETEGEK